MPEAGKKRREDHVPRRKLASVRRAHQVAARPDAAAADSTAAGEDTASGGSRCGGCCRGRLAFGLFLIVCQGIAVMVVLTFFTLTVVPDEQGHASHYSFHIHFPDLHAHRLRPTVAEMPVWKNQSSNRGPSLAGGSAGQELPRPSIPPRQQPALRGGDAWPTGGAKGAWSTAAAAAQALRGQGAASGALPALAPPSGAALFMGDTWLEVGGLVDAEELSFKATIFLPEVSADMFPPASPSIKTIAATKQSGCVNHHGMSEGWSFFVHQWGTTNRELRLSWTDSRSSCIELYSATSLVPYNSWVTVGFVLSKASSAARILIEGNVVADTRAKLGSLFMSGHSVRFTEVDVSSRSIRREKLIMVGSHPPVVGERDASEVHCFIGYISRLQVEAANPDSANSQDGSVAASTQLMMTVELLFSSQAQQITNIIDGKQVLVGHAGRDNKAMRVVPWEPQPQHPLRPAPAPEVEMQQTQEHADEAQRAASGAARDPSSLTEKELAELRATWPESWTKHFSEDVLLKSQMEADHMALEVKAAMAHGWKGYRKSAWGHDELKPLTGSFKDWCGMAVTMIDSLSTLWLMGMKDEFSQAEAWLESHPLPASATGRSPHSVFEITIRVLGGLLSAYSLSGKEIFLTNARHLGDVLLKAFETPSGLPFSQIDVRTGRTSKHSWVSHGVLAEATTLQLELRYLSHATGNTKYKDKGDKAFEAVLSAGGDDGIVPIFITEQWSRRGIGFVGRVSFGAMGDSYFEYLLKQWLQSGKKEKRLKDAWKKSMKDMQEELVKTTQGGLTYVAEMDHGRLRHRMDHLACFVSGMLVLGARTLPSEEVDARWEPLADQLARTCYEMYRRSPSGLAPEYVVFHQDKASGSDMTIPHDGAYNILRPEAIEALYYMHYFTGDPKYRKWAIDMFHAFIKHTKVNGGFAGLGDVRVPKNKKDSMESFFLAETLKYFYLIFARHDQFSLEEFVLNTEAHPLKMWT